MKWATALSTEPTLALALDEGVAGIKEALGSKKAHLVFAFASQVYAEDMALLPKTIAEQPAATVASKEIA